jgi:hypothetical protein
MLQSHRKMTLSKMLKHTLKSFCFLVLTFLALPKGTIAQWFIVNNLPDCSDLKLSLPGNEPNTALCYQDATCYNISTGADAFASMFTWSFIVGDQVKT